MPNWIMHIRYLPLLGWGPTAVIVLGAVALVVWGHLKSRRTASRPLAVSLLSLRLLVVAVLAWVLAGPCIDSEQTTTTTDQPTPVLFLADTSASMAQRDVVDPDALAVGGATHHANLISRWQAIKRYWFDPKFINRLNEHGFDARLVGFDSRLQPMSFDEARRLEIPTGETTDLYGAMDSVIRQRVSSVNGGAQITGNTPGVVVLLSDGHDTGRGVAPVVTERLRGAGWLVLAVMVGSSRSVPDLAVAAWADADVLLEGQSTWIEATVSQVGLSHRRARVDLLREGRLIESREVAFEGKPIARVRFPVTPPVQPGQRQTIHAYRVVTRLIADPSSRVPRLLLDDEEPLQENNRRWVFIRTSSERIRVALFEGQPYWDTRALARVLQEDAQVDLTAVYGLGPDRSVVLHSAGSQGLDDADNDPWTQARLNRFDVVILGKGVQRFWGGDRAQMLVDYVTQRGGALVLARGQAFDLSTPSGRQAQALLVAIEPVRWGQETVRHLQMQLTEQGQASPLTDFAQIGPTGAILTDLPDMLAATQIEREKAASIVLLRQSVGVAGSDQGPANRSAEGDDSSSMAAVVHQNAGRGRVFAVLSDGLWRWSFLPSTLDRYGSVYQVFWARVIRWLATGGEFLPGQSVSMSLSRLAAQPGDTVSLTVTARHVEAQGFEPRITMVSPDGKTRVLSLARAGPRSPRYVATIQPQTPGVYEFAMEQNNEATTAHRGGVSNRLTRRLAVYDQSLERLDPSARPGAMAALSQATGGRCLNVDQREQVFEYAQRARQTRHADSRPVYVFNHPAVFAVIVGLLGFEWFVRRWHGLA